MKPLPFRRRPSSEAEQKATTIPVEPRATTAASIPKDAVVGHRLVDLWQTPWMAPVCIRDAGGMRYECRIALELEAGHRVELARGGLLETTGGDGWQQLRPEEHHWQAEGSPLGWTLIAAAVDHRSVVHLLLDDDSLLSIDDYPGGPLRVERVDPSAPETKQRLASMVDAWTGAPLIRLP